MESTLVELFKHNLWANLRLLDVCARLGDDKLDASAPGTYGRVRDTLLHIVGAEEMYVAALTGQRIENPLRLDMAFPGFEELRQRSRRSGEELAKIVATIPPTQVIHGTRQGKPYAISALLFFLQAINHATEHRAHVVTIISQNGVEPPAIDGWAYARELGIIDLG